MAALGCQNLEGSEQSRAAPQATSTVAVWSKEQRGVRALLRPPAPQPLAHSQFPLVWRRGWRRAQVQLETGKRPMRWDQGQGEPRKPLGEAAGVSTPGCPAVVQTDRTQVAWRRGGGGGPGRQDQPQGQFRPQAALAGRTQGESQGPQPHVGMEQGVSPSDRDSAGQGQRTLTSSSDSSFPWTSPPCMTSCRVGPGPDVGPHSARKSLGQRQVQHRWLRRSPSGRRVPLWVRASCSGPSVGPPLADGSGVHPAVCLVAGVDSGGSGEQVLLGGACSPTRQGQKHGGRRGTQRSSSCSTQLMGQGTQCGEPQPHPVGARPRPTPNRSPRFTIRL